jgi:hypothetical protein
VTILIALIVLIAAGAVGLAVAMAYSGRIPKVGPDSAAARRDREENAGGSRHIRTTPSWRDRLESMSSLPESTDETPGSPEPVAKSVPPSTN